MGDRIYMDKWVDAFDYAEIVFGYGLFMWPVYISFFILSLIVYKKNDRTRKITGNVMIASSVPGMLISIYLLGLLLYAWIAYHNILVSGDHMYESLKIRSIRDLCNSVPITLLMISILIFAVLALTAIVCGIIIIRRSRKKATGIISVIYGTLLIAFTLFVLDGVMLFLSDS